MARMIPPIISSETRSPGEREIFQRLRDDPDTRDWIVLHSLDVAAHRRQVTGEIDFVVIIPGKGVLCLEVKAHTRIKCEHGLWFFGSAPTPETRGPFKQAAESMHSIRTRLAARRSDFGRIVFWTAVLFPYVDFTTTSEEWHRWQVIDRRAFQSRPIAALLLGVLNSAREFLKTRPTAGWFDAGAPTPLPDQCQTLADMLRPDFEFFESPKARSGRRDEELKRYTLEQSRALDAMITNPRVIFDGPAGTGKTLLAIEAARRARAAGRRVLLICYNRFLGQWLTDQTEDLRPEVVAGTLHSRMVPFWPGALPATPAQAFWETELPLQAALTLLEDGSVEQFDELIVDEAQDILREEYLDFLDALLHGGLAAGRWRIFGDFERQAIFAAAKLSLTAFQATRGGQAPVYALRENCRNTPRIAALVQLLGGLSPDYSRILRPDNGVEPEIHRFRDGEHQRFLLAQALRNLVDEGFGGRDIVVLSPRADSRAVAGLMMPPWSDRLRAFDRAGRDHIRYTTIHSYKGLEAPAVIVTDIDRVGDLETMDLFYVAITRSVDRLILLVDERIASAMASILFAA